MIYDTEIALAAFAKTIHAVLGERLADGRVVRDIFGRLSFAPKVGLPEDVLESITAAIPSDVAPYVAATGAIIRDPSLAEMVLAEDGILRFANSDLVKFTLLDRRLAGEDWMQKPSVLSRAVPRFAFYGLKGGVGRSTALAISAVDLARQGLNVLVVDLDLEAPGVGSILLNPKQLPEYGVLDWLAAGSAGLDTLEMMPDMIGGSAFSRGAGVVDVVPASGVSSLQTPEGFLSKLARAYTPGASTGRLSQLNFTQKIEMLIADLNELRPYDVILLDVRAGLHETSAASLIGLGATSFLFGTSSSQTFAGYAVLFSSIRQTMVSWPEAPDLRDRFQMVQGRASNLKGDRAEFRASCWQLWLDHLYDSAENQIDISSYSFDLDDPTGPHFPWVISSNEIYSSFDPQNDASYLDPGSYMPVFDGFLSKFRARMIQIESPE